MDENTTVQTEQAGAIETSTAFDEGWDDDWGTPAGGDGPAASEEPASETGEPAEVSEGTEADADQQNADGNEGGEAEAAPEGEAAGETGSSDQGDAFVLKHLGEERTVGRDEVTVLAQKGLDYDRVKEKWDGVKDDISRLRSYEQFLKELAESRGGDIESLMDETRTQVLMNRAKAKGETMDASVAAAQAVRMRMQPAQAEPEAQAQAPRDANEEVRKFLEAYPNVKAEDIPKEVWEEVNKTGDLVGAYRGFENRKLAEDNKRLQKELETAKQQQKNKERSTGSPKSTGSAAARDPFEEGWDSLT